MIAPSIRPSFEKYDIFQMNSPPILPPFRHQTENEFENNDVFRHVFHISSNKKRLAYRVSLRLYSLTNFFYSIRIFI
jgi:hypothetical protein